ncbi:hypothetical protein E2C01_004550 [Portunus trituberculatus]|uniref:Uncharacterized protein n=1 Tax=Portunus trituberculatus TaxID=210409 RepID=A0A5B7CRN8_PORTR|nr:hypothetical protein [Portunus trituberculatus]
MPDSRDDLANLHHCGPHSYINTESFRNEILLTGVYTGQPPQRARVIKNRIPFEFGLLFFLGVVAACGVWRWNTRYFSIMPAEKAEREKEVVGNKGCCNFLIQK